MKIHNIKLKQKHLFVIGTACFLMAFSAYAAHAAIQNKIFPKYDAGQYDDIEQYYDEVFYAGNEVVHLSADDPRAQVPQELLEKL